MVSKWGHFLTSKMTISGKSWFYSFDTNFWCFILRVNCVHFFSVRLKNQLLLPAFGTKMTLFFGVFCYEAPGKWSKKGSKKWSKMTLFWPIFDHLLDRLICVCLILRPNYVHIWVKHEKMVQKGVQKWEHGLTTRIFRQNWVIFHLFLCFFEAPLSWLPKNVDTDIKVVKKGPKMGQKLTYFWVIFKSFLCFSRHPSYWRLKYEGNKISGEKGSKKWSKMAQNDLFLGHFWPPF